MNTWEPAFLKLQQKWKKSYIACMQNTVFSVYTLIEMVLLLSLWIDAET